MEKLKNWVSHREYKPVFFSSFPGGLTVKREPSTDDGTSWKPWVISMSSYMSQQSLSCLGWDGESFWTCQRDLQHQIFFHECFLSSPCWNTAIPPLSWTGVGGWYHCSGKGWRLATELSNLDEVASYLEPYNSMCVTQIVSIQLLVRHKESTAHLSSI